MLTLLAIWVTVISSLLGSHGVASASAIERPLKPNSPKEPSADKTSSGHKSGGYEHIVLLGAGAPHPHEVLKRVELSPNHSDVTHVFNNPIFQGFVAKMKSHCIDSLNNMSDVGIVEQAVDIRVHGTRSPVNYNLQRISDGASSVGTDDNADTYTYTYDDPLLGAGVDVYTVDTGIRTNGGMKADHEVFKDHAELAFSCPGLNTTDDDGHGTHVAGIIVGDPVGVASNANLIAVKILDGNGVGSSTNFMSGLDFISDNHHMRLTNPAFSGSVINVSLGMNSSLDPTGVIARAISKMSSSGIHFSIAAGNMQGDACNFTPSSLGGPKAGSIITTGSIGIGGQISYFSNTGSCVDLYAPGENIRSSTNTSATSYAYMDGTSMSTPHTSGVMAYLLASNPALKTDPRALKAKVMSLALPGIVSGNTVAGDQKLLLNNGNTGSAVSQFNDILPSRSKRSKHRSVSRVMFRKRATTEVS